MDLYVELAALAAGAAMAVMGWRAYSGRWRKWVTYGGLVPGVRSYPAPGLLYAGIGFLLAPVAVWMSESATPKPLLAATVVVAIGGVLIGLLSMAWLPRFMRPAWVRSAEEAERNPRPRLLVRQRPDAAPPKFPSDRSNE